MTPDRFRVAARAYFVYGVIYWFGGSYLVLHGVGRGSALTPVWILLGAGLVVIVPFLLRRPRAWFERWILSRRDFARILAVLMALRALKVGEVAVRPGGASVSAPWGGVVTFRFGASIFFVVTVVAAWFVARAAWQAEANRP